MSWIVERVKPVEEDINYIAANMREIDKHEVFEIAGLSPKQGIVQSIDAGHRNVVCKLNGEPCLVMGVVPTNLLLGEGIPWLLATDVVTENAGIFMRMTKELHPVMFKGYKFLTNFIHEDNKQSIVWLKYLGFQFHEPRPVGWRGEMFMQFTKVM